MKNRLLKVAAITFVLIGVWVYAAPGDIVITFTIPAADVAEFRAGFLREHPIPVENVVDPNGLPVTDANGVRLTEPKYTDKQWFKHIMKAYANREVLAGNKKLSAEAANNKKDIMQ